MKIIPIHYTPSKPVNNWHAIEAEAQEMAKFVDEKGGMFALHHSQVSERPLNYFVLHAETLKDFLPELGSRFIINPVITGFMKEAFMSMPEGCVSFPYRKPKNMMRCYVLKVVYYIPDESQPNGMKRMEKQVERIIAQIFQHECGHAEGKNIFFDTPKA